MKVVVDTNVVVSAILRDRLPEKILLFVIGRPDFEWVASADIFDGIPRGAPPAEIYAARVFVVSMG